MAYATTSIDEGFKTWATLRQTEYIEAINRLGSMRAAAREMHIRSEVIVRSMQSLRLLAAARGYSPDHDMTRPVPDTHLAKGISTYYDQDGKVRGQWVKSTLDGDKAEAAKRAALDALAADLPRLKPLPGPKQTAKDLCNVYTLTDAHVGSLCWHREGGYDWDLKIAERVLVGCFEKMLVASPPASVGIVAQLGDFLHQDSMLPVTPVAGNILDSDGRFPKVVAVAITVLRRIVDMALAKHDKVVVLMAEGNHDMTSSIWLRAMFAALYENEPRIEVIDSPLPYYVYQHGKTMIGWHHGHLKKNDQLPLLFAAQFPQNWGASAKRYIHTGHRHHVEEKEHSGVTVMQHSTLTGRDAYSARMGYVNDRQVTAVTYHDTFGKHSTATVCPEMVG